MLRAVVVYESMYGNTEEVARAVADGLATHLPVEIHEVSSAPTSIAGDTLLVVGGPTHAFGMSRDRTREDAAARVPEVVSRGDGVREWLERLTITGRVLATSVDTKTARPRLPGSAGHAIGRELREKGCEVLHPAETFLVDGMEGPLREGEADRARALGEQLGTLAADLGPPAPAARGGVRTARHALLALLAGVMAIGGVAGGLGLMNGADDFFGDQTATIYDRLPFDSPQFAGIALLLAVAVPMAVTAVLAWRASRHAAAAGAAAGTVLVGWIIVQLAIIATFFWLQPVCIAAGLAVAGLALRLGTPAPATERPARARHTRSAVHTTEGESR